MTSREQYFVQQVVDKYNEVIVQLQVALTERDTMLEEVNLLKEELKKSYQEVAELKGSNPDTPMEISFTEEGAKMIPNRPVPPENFNGHK